MVGVVAEVSREFGDHLLQLGLVAGLVGLDEGRELLLERAVFGLFGRGLILLDVGLERRDLGGLFLGRQLAVAVDLHDRLVGFKDADRQQLIVVRRDGTATRSGWPGSSWRS